jgi:hypothetical protein
MIRSSFTYFPDPDGNELRPLGQAFVRMMFAHAELEREILSLASAIKGNSDFQKLPPPRDRPDWIKKLIDEHAPGILETDAICRLLSQAEQLCDDRDLLAHGHWWRFDPAGAGTITIRGDPSSEHQDFTTEKINRTASDLKDITRKLYALRPANPRPDPAARSGQDLAAAKRLAEAPIGLGSSTR